MQPSPLPPAWLQGQKVRLAATKSSMGFAEMEEQLRREVPPPIASSAAIASPQDAAFHPTLLPPSGNADTPAGIPACADEATEPNSQSRSNPAESPTVPEPASTTPSDVAGGSGRMSEDPPFQYEEQRWEWYRHHANTSRPDLSNFPKALNGSTQHVSGCSSASRGHVEENVAHKPENGREEIGSHPDDVPGNIVQGPPGDGEKTQGRQKKERLVQSDVRREVFTSSA